MMKLEPDSHGLLLWSTVAVAVYGLLQILDLSSGSSIESDALALVHAQWSDDHNPQFQAKLQRCALGQFPSACTIW